MELARRVLVLGGPWVPWLPGAPWLLWTLRLCLWLLMLAASAQLLRMAAFGWRRPAPRRDDEAPLPEPPPRITVQIPLRNERFAAARAIRSACALDWPRDRLEIQVLDDSDDDTREVVDGAAAAARAAGHDVRVLRRRRPAGYKAGHLQQGLSVASGEFIAVLDADSAAPPELLRRLLPPLLRDERAAFAQGRWSFENERQGLLTRLQALILHGLMLVEQDRLSRLGLPLPFNGSGGLWRRAAIEAAGGWVPTGTAPLTEDLDLARRARRRGYRGLQVPEVAVATELPATMAAFRAQQSRWVRGAGQVLRAHLREALCGAPDRAAEPPAARRAMLAQLLRHGRQPCLALYAVTLPLAALPSLAPAPAPLLSAALCALLLAAAALHYGAALRRLGRSPWEALPLAPLLLALSLGLSLCLSRALLQGLADDGAEAEFVRTPKVGGAGPAGAPPYRAQGDPLAVVEMGLGILNLIAAAALLLRGEVLGALGAGLLVGGGLLWVGLASLTRR